MYLYNCMTTFIYFAILFFCEIYIYSMVYSRACPNCRFFLPHYQKDVRIGNLYGKCRKFIRWETPDHEYEYAVKARANSTQCGNEGLLFELGDQLDM